MILTTLVKTGDFNFCRKICFMQYVLLYLYKAIAWNKRGE